MIVFDSSTLILVAKIDMLDLLIDHASLSMAIPAQVERECCGRRGHLDALIIERAIERDRIIVKSVKNRRLVSRIQNDFRLGTGEAEAIALAVETSAQLLGIDDKAGINACKLLNVPFTTAIALLLRAREKHLLDVLDSLQKLGLLAKFGRYKPSIVEDARQKLEARA